MSNMRTGLTHIARKFVTCVPSDTVPVMPGATGLYIGGAGNVTVIDQDNNTTTFTAPLVGAVLDISPKFVKATLTTATLMVLCY